MKIALVCLYDKHFEPLTSLTIPPLTAYCQRWGYTPYFGQPDAKYDPRNTWDRFVILYDLLEQGFDAVMWLDADTILTNHHIRIEDRLGSEKFVLSTDLHGINAGVMIARNHVLTRELLLSIIQAEKGLFDKHPHREQEMLSHYLASPHYEHLATILPQRMMNAFPHELYGRSTQYPGNWHQGDWIIHFPGMRMFGRLEAMPPYLKLIEGFSQ